MSHLLLAFASLVTIILASLTTESLRKKVVVFVAVGLTNALHLALTGHGREAWNTFGVDYVQFIPVPVCCVMVAGLGLFTVTLHGDGKSIGWLLLLFCPLVGNLATTWSLIPVLLSLIPRLMLAYPQAWKEITILVAIFAMNLLALGTLAADPPQAYWSVKEGEKGEPLGFWFPATIFVGFFGVVAQTHVAVAALEPPRVTLPAVVAGLTAWADNATAFAVGYPAYEGLPRHFMAWYNLFPAVTFGGRPPWATARRSPCCWLF